MEECELEQEKKRRCMQPDCRSSGIIDKVKELEFSEIPSEVIVRIASFVPHGWYLRLVSRNWVLIPRPTSKDSQELQFHLDRRFRALKLESIDTHLYHAHNFPPYFGYTRYITLPNTVTMFQKYPVFKKIKWYEFLLEHSQVTGLSKPDENTNNVLNFLMVATLPSIKLISDSRLKLVSRVITSITEMTCFAGQAKFKDNQFVLKLHLKDVRKEGDVIELSASGKTRDEAATNFKLKLFMCILHHYMIFDKIAEKCSKIDKYKDFVSLLIRKTTLDSKINVMPTFQMIAKGNNWVCKVKVHDLEVESAAKGSQKRAKANAAKLMFRALQ